jgi:predicted Fe-Mo cluster-binding NifX family protein
MNVIIHEPEVVLTGNCGPKAYQTLNAADIKVVVGVSGRIEDAIQAYLRGEFEHAKDARKPEKSLGNKEDKYEVCYSIGRGCALCSLRSLSKVCHY